VLGEELLALILEQVQVAGAYPTYAATRPVTDGRRRPNDQLGGSRNVALGIIPRREGDDPYVNCRFREMIVVRAGSR
jgi:hypothetical protein